MTLGGDLGLNQIKEPEKRLFLFSIRILHRNTHSLQRNSRVLTVVF